MKMLGLIGGTSWSSTIDYYRLINEGVAARLGGSQSARCIIHSFNFGDIVELTQRQDWDGVFALVRDASINLRKSGVDAIVLCANTLHVVADRLEERVQLPLIHIVDAAAVEIRRTGFERVSLLGTRHTMELPFFKDRLAWHGIATVVPEPGDREFIHQTIFSELGKNILRDETRSRYLSIIDSLAKQGAKASILGCTEIPMLIKQQDATVPIFDTTALHARAAVDFALI